jgi:hypothetical protein
VLTRLEVMRMGNSSCFRASLNGVLFLAFGCSAWAPKILTCQDASDAVRQTQPWILRIDEAQRIAEMVVYVPAKSIRQGTPAGNRRGTVLVNERAYEVTIPSDSGGQGEQRWARLQFQFVIDRYTGLGTLTIGEKQRGDVIETPIRCEPGAKSPRL